MKQLLLIFTLLASTAQAEPTDLFPITGTQVQLIDGEVVLSDFTTAKDQDSVYVVEFFSTRCGWCQANATYLEQLASEYAEESRVKIIGVGIDQSASAYGWWFSRFDSTFPIIFDEGRVLFAKFAAPVTPYTMVFECAGTKLYQHGGFLGLDGLESLRQNVNAGLEVTCSDSTEEDPDEI